MSLRVDSTMAVELLKNMYNELYVNGLYSDYADIKDVIDNSESFTLGYERLLMHILPNANKETNPNAWTYGFNSYERVLNADFENHMIQNFGKEFTQKFGNFMIALTYKDEMVRQGVFNYQTIVSELEGLHDLAPEMSPFVNQMIDFDNSQIFEKLETRNNELQALIATVIKNAHISSISDKPLSVSDIKEVSNLVNKVNDMAGANNGSEILNASFRLNNLVYLKENEKRIASDFMYQKLEDLFDDRGDVVKSINKFYSETNADLLKDKLVNSDQVLEHKKIKPFFRSNEYKTNTASLSDNFDVYSKLYSGDHMKNKTDNLVGELERTYSLIRIATDMDLIINTTKQNGPLKASDSVEWSRLKAIQSSIANGFDEETQNLISGSKLLNKYSSDVKLGEMDRDTQLLWDARLKMASLELDISDEYLLRIENRSKILTDNLSEMKVNAEDFPTLFSAKKILREKLEHISVTPKQWKNTTLSL